MIMSWSGLARKVVVEMMVDVVVFMGLVYVTCCTWHSLVGIPLSTTERTWPHLAVCVAPERGTKTAQATGYDEQGFGCTPGPFGEMQVTPIAIGVLLSARCVAVRGNASLLVAVRSAVRRFGRTSRIRTTLVATIFSCCRHGAVA